jgi:hypothetical protein
MQEAKGRDETEVAVAAATLPGALVAEPHTRFARLRSKFSKAQSQKTSGEPDIERSKDAPRNELEDIEPLSYWQLYSWVLLQVLAACPLPTQLLEAAPSARNCSPIKALAGLLYRVWEVLRIDWIPHVLCRSASSMDMVLMFCGAAGAIAAGAALPLLT